MAEVAAIVAPIIKPLISELSSGVWREMRMIRGVEEDLEKLKRLLETINDVLEDAERRSVRDEALRGWLMKIKDAALDADDVVDDFQTEALRRRCLNLNINGKVRNFFSSNNPVLFLIKMSHEIKDVISRFDELARLRRDFHLQEGSPSSSSSEVVLDRETCSSVDESKVYGREEDKEHIINLLLNVDQDKDLSVLLIVGLGGVGKTTLAQLVYNDGRVQEHFEMEKWVCVGENFVVKDIICAIAGVTICIIAGDTKAPTLEDAQQRLRDKLRGKMFLLVLDDVWNENTAKWERLEDLLKCGKLGSKIIVTTRNERVATMMGTTEILYNLNVLSEDKCWDLFKMIAFGPGKAEESRRLKEIGKEIVKKCGGLPLAVKSLGGLMAFKRGDREWLAIRDSVIWKLPLEGEIKKILPSLRLSYDHLSSKLKQCFAYCSLFPKDHEFERSKLIQFWIAVGLIQSSGVEESVEDIGSDYFNILLQRSFLQNEVINDFGEVISCEMHDLVHDLACLVSKGEFSIVQATENKISLTCRYSSVICHAYIDKLALHINNEAKKLRSLHILGISEFYSIAIRKFELGPVSLVTHLRVLDVSAVGMAVLPKIVGKLKHLRFLDISCSRIKELPKFVCRLYNLQTLNLRDCTSLQRLPKGIKNLRSLRHLDIEGCVSLTEMPSGIGRLLSGLQTMPLFIVDQRCHISELQNLNSISIKGEFSIKIRSQMDPREAKDANLGAKANIQSLKLEWMNPSFEDEEGALENLQPHPNLTRLSIYDYPGSMLPNWVASLGELKKLVLMRIHRCESLPSLGQLPSLEHLEVWFMPRLRRMGEEVYGDDGVFPALKYLRLHDLPDLEEWFVVARNGIIVFPLLEELKIFRCPKLRLERAHLPPSLLKLYIHGIDEELLSAGEGGCLQGLSRLTDLHIANVIPSSNSSTEWGGLHHLTALRSLRIFSCGGVTKLPEGVLQLPSLQNLKLYFNYRLNYLGQRRPLFCTSLLSLTIQSCHDLIALPEWVGDLTSLRDLSLFECPKLEQLLEALQCLTALQKLEICKCDELRKLPEGVGDLTSLRDLTLYSCPKLEQLPDGLQRLTSLQRLHIVDCHLLKSRCEKETGEDWHKIAHISNIQIHCIKIY